MPVLLKTRDLERIGDAVDQVETTPINRKTSQRPKPPIHQSGDEQTVRVSSATTTAGRYPGYLVQLDPVTNSYADLCQIWIVEINAGTLTTQRYKGKRNGTADGTDATLAVFEVELGGSGGAGSLEVTDGTTDVTGVTKVILADPLKIVSVSGTEVTVGLKTLTITCNSDGSISVSWS